LAIAAAHTWSQRSVPADDVIATLRASTSRDHISAHIRSQRFASMVSVQSVSSTDAGGSGRFAIAAAHIWSQRFVSAHTEIATLHVSTNRDRNASCQHKT